MLKSYTTSSGAQRARPGCPLVRILRDPEDIWVPTLALDTEVHVLTCDRPNGPAHFAGSVTLQDIVDAEIARQDIGFGWRGLKAIPDAANANNLRIMGEGVGQVCKVYGCDPVEAALKAKILLAALALVMR